MRNLIVMGLAMAAIVAVGCGVNQRRVVVKREAVQGLSSSDWKIESTPAEAAAPTPAQPAVGNPEQ